MNKSPAPLTKADVFNICVPIGYAVSSHTINDTIISSDDPSSPLGGYSFSRALKSIQKSFWAHQLGREKLSVHLLITHEHKIIHTYGIIEIDEHEVQKHQNINIMNQEYIMFLWI